MLDNKTKERIRQEAELPIYNDLVLPGIGKKFSAIERFVYDHQPVNSADAETFREQLKAVIVEAREAEVTRAQPLIEAYRELHSISNDQLNEMEKLIKDYKPDREKISRAYELLKKIEALTKYNNPK